MAISYPVTPPSSPTPSSVRWTEINAIGGTVSQYTLQRQIYDWGGAAWQVEVEFDPMTREEAQPWFAFLSSLRGQRGSFYFGDYAATTTLGTSTGTPRVKGASQTGTVLLTDGWTNSTLVLKAGDMFSIDYRLYRALKDVTSDSSGNASIDLFPYIRGHVDDSLITVTSPKGTFRLVDNSIMTQDLPRVGLYLVSFTAIEAVPYV